MTSALTGTITINYVIPERLGLSESDIVDWELTVDNDNNQLTIDAPNHDEPLTTTVTDMDTDLLKVLTAYIGVRLAQASHDDRTSTPSMFHSTPDAFKKGPLFA